jgi:hypothetical protein
MANKKNKIPSFLPPLFARLLFLLAILAAIALGVSLGEEFLPPFPANALVYIGLVGSILAGWMLGKYFKGYSRAVLWVLPLIFLSTWFIAVLDVEWAMRDCESKADQLRADLVLFKKKTGAFPLTIDQLGWSQLPGKRLLGPSVLHYDFGPRGFLLYFSPQTRPGFWRDCSKPREK